MVQLRKLEETDVERFRNWIGQPHIVAWFEHPAAWLKEVEQREGAFSWMHHYIVEYQGAAVGFCQYFACKDSQEDFGVYQEADGCYSVDYLIGETDYLGKGLGKQIIGALVEQIMLHEDAVRVVAKPDVNNKASCSVFRGCGFVLDEETGYYVRER